MDMLYKILALALGLLLLILHERLLLRPRIRIHLLAYALIPTKTRTRWLDLANPPSLARSTRPFVLALSLDDFITENDQSAFYQTLKTLASRYPFTVQWQAKLGSTTFSKLNQVISQSLEMEIAVESIHLLPNEEPLPPEALHSFLVSFKSAYPYLKVSVDFHLWSPDPQELAWNSLVSASAGRMDDLVVNLKAAEVQALSQVPDYFIKIYQQMAWLQHSARSQQPLHLDLSNHTPAHWVALLGEQLAYLLSWQEPNIQTFIASDTPEQNTVAGALSTMLREFLADQAHIQPVKIEGAPVLVDERGKKFPALLGWGWHRDWEVNLLFLNLSDRAQVLEMQHMFVKKYVYEQLSLPKSYWLYEDIQFQDLQVNIQTRTGDLSLPPYSITRLSAQDLVPSAIYHPLPDGTHWQISPEIVDAYLKINFYLSRKQSVLLKIFDSSGRRLYHLHQPRQKAGHYEIRLNTSRLASGHYRILLKINSRFGVKFFWKES